MLSTATTSINATDVAPTGSVEQSDERKRTFEQAERYVTWAAELGCRYSNELWGAQILKAISKHKRLATCGIEPDRMYCATLKSIVAGQDHVSYEYAISLLLQVFAWNIKDGDNQKGKSPDDLGSTSDNFGMQHNKINTTSFEKAILALKTELVLRGSGEQETNTNSDQDSATAPSRKGKGKRRKAGHAERDAASTDESRGGDTSTFAFRLGHVNRVFTNPFMVHGLKGSLGRKSALNIEKVIGAQGVLGGTTDDNTRIVGSEAFAGAFRRRRWELVQWAMESDAAKRNTIAEQLRRGRKLQREPLAHVMDFLVGYEATMMPSEIEHLMQPNFTLPPPSPAPLTADVGASVVDAGDDDNEAGSVPDFDSLAPGGALVSDTPAAGDIVAAGPTSALPTSHVIPVEQNGSKNVGNDEDGDGDDDDELYAQTQELGVTRKTSAINFSDSDDSDTFDLMPIKRNVQITDCD